MRGTTRERLLAMREEQADDVERCIFLINSLSKDLGEQELEGFWRQARRTKDKIERYQARMQNAVGNMAALDESLQHFPDPSQP